MAIETPVFVQEQLMDSSVKNYCVNRQLLRRYIEAYRIYVKYEGEEPTVVNLHTCHQRYGGPEEGGWYYTEGWPEANICVFSKKQAIRDAIHLHLKAKEEYGERIDYLGWPTWEVTFSRSYGEHYPTHRPHYE